MTRPQIRADGFSPNSSTPNPKMNHLFRSLSTGPALSWRLPRRSSLEYGLRCPIKLPSTEIETTMQLRVLSSAQYLQLVGLPSAQASRRAGQMPCRDLNRICLKSRITARRLWQCWITSASVRGKVYVLWVSSISPQIPGYALSVHMYAFCALSVRGQKADYQYTEDLGHPCLTSGIKVIKHTFDDSDDSLREVRHLISFSSWVPCVRAMIDLAYHYSRTAHLSSGDGPFHQEWAEGAQLGLRVADISPYFRVEHRRWRRVDWLNVQEVAHY
jgi:hypothetical protein